MSRKTADAVEAARAAERFVDMADLVRRSGVRGAALARLAAADAFRSMNLNRRQAVWQALAMGDRGPPLLNETEDDDPVPRLPESSLEDQVVTDYDTTGLSLKAHPIGLLRRELSALKVLPAADLKRTRHGAPTRVAGLVLVRQRPATASGIVFYTLEDETGVANLIVRPRVYERCRRTARNAPALIAEGRVERQGSVVHLQVSHLSDIGAALAGVRNRSRDFR